MPQGRIESINHDARGVTRLDGKTIFVDGALPGELIEFASYRRKPHYELAQTLRIIQASPCRVNPVCPHFGVCGGCSLQHFAAEAQVAAKQRILEDNFWHLGKLVPEQLFPPVYGNAWGYRHRARLGVRHVPKKGGILVGFHERKSSYIADMRVCPILPERVSRLLLPLRELVASLSIHDRMPQIEVSLGARQLALVFRNLENITAADESRLITFSRDHDIHAYLQPGGPNRLIPLDPEPKEALTYTLPEFDVELAFSPTEFTQVNHAVNRILVRRALALLEIKSGERIADMFCGLGNFSLPMARQGGHVVGIEGSSELVRRAEENARVNGLSSQAEFAVANLFQATPESIATLGYFDKMLIDPPREGAAELIKALGNNGPVRIVYVSCNPATLARDASILVHQNGYRLMGAGVVNMFPQTSHVESIACFERI